MSVRLDNGDAVTHDALCMFMTFLMMSSLRMSVYGL